MKKTIMVAVVAFMLIGGVVLVSTAAPKGKDTIGQDWSNLKIVAYPNGHMGFFDPATGKLYIYNSDLNNCVQTRQLSKLGQPIRKL